MPGGNLLNGGKSAMKVTHRGIKKSLALVVLGSAVLLIGLSGPQLAGAASAKNGEETYGKKCAMCHAKDGSGNSPMGKNLKLRDLRSKEVQAQSDKQLTDIIAKGKSPMPGYASQLSESDIEDLVAFIREMGNKK
jgi:cytochrome c6